MVICMFAFDFVLSFKAVVQLHTQRGQKDPQQQQSTDQSSKRNS
jgi:hypothetical protein